MNPLTARAPRNPFGPQPIKPPAVPGWGGALTQPRPVGPQGPQVQYVPGLMPWSGTGPWSGAPIAPMIPRGQRFNPGAPTAPMTLRGQRFNPGAPVPSPIIPRGQRFNPGAPPPSPVDPTAILRSVAGPRQSPTGWARKVPGIFDQQRGGVRPDPLRPDRRTGNLPFGTRLTKLAAEIDHAVFMGYMPDPRFVQAKVAARRKDLGAWRDGMVRIAHRIAPEDPYPESRVTQEARQLLHE